MRYLFPIVLLMVSCAAAPVQSPPFASLQSHDGVRIELYKAERTLADLAKTLPYRARWVDPKKTVEGCYDFRWYVEGRPQIVAIIFADRMLMLLPTGAFSIEESPAEPPQKKKGTSANLGRTVL